MNGNDARQDSPVWACNIAGGLVAWVILVFVAMFSLIGMSAFASSQGKIVPLGSALFYAEVFVAISLAGIASYFASTAAYRWLSRQRSMFVYVFVGVLFLVTVISFPMPFAFVLGG
jgi:hypothetical protein